MKIKTMFAMLAIFAAAFALAACDAFGTIIGTISGLKYSIQVDNQAGGARAVLASGDEVELYIRGFAYEEDANNRVLCLVSDGDTDNGSKGGIIDNAGWYSVDADLDVENDVNPGPYSSFTARINYLRVNGVVYRFPTTDVVYGHPSSIHGSHSDYPDNFAGITISEYDLRRGARLKTIITIEPEITEGATSYTTGPQDFENATFELRSDAFKYIKVEGRLE